MNLLFANGYGQVKAGDNALPIIFNNSFPKNFEVPSGKIILLDFWATWCTPCIEGIRESNEWVREFKNQIEFICITDQTSKNVEQFIKREKFNHVFLVDSTGKTSKAFGVTSLPTAFLIDTNGIVVWSGHSEEITKTVLEEYLRDGIFRVNNKTNHISMGMSLENKLKQTTIGDIEGPQFMMLGAKGDSIKYLIKNTPLNTIIEALFNKPKQVIFLKNKFTTHYDFQISKSHVDISSINLQILDEISKTIPFSYKIENRDTCILELTIIDNNILNSNLTPYDSLIGPKEDYSFDYEQLTETLLLTGNNITLQQLTEQLAEFYNQPLILKTSGKDRFMFYQLPISEINDLNKILLKNYGLYIEKARRNIPFLIIE